MKGWLQWLPLPLKVLAYAVAYGALFALAVGIGGVVATVSERGLDFPGAVGSQQVSDPVALGDPGSVGENLDDHHIGVWYINAAGMWTVFNQDLEEMPEGITFDVYIPPPSEGVFTHQATTQNTSGDSTYIDNPSTNENRDATLYVTQNWNPGGVGGTYNDHSVDVRYDADARRWVIFNQDGEEMPEEAAFNVNVFPPLGEPAFVHRTTGDNILQNWTYLDNPLTNENQDAILFVAKR